MFRSTRTQRTGFSLIELLLVVAILGIIAAVVVPRVSTTSQTANDTVEAHHLAQLNSLTEQYFLENNAWPSDLTDLVPMMPDGVPVNPNGGTYLFNGTTNRVEVGP